MSSAGGAVLSRNPGAGRTRPRRNRPGRTWPSIRNVTGRPASRTPLTSCSRSARPGLRLERGPPVVGALPILRNGARRAAFASRRRSPGRWPRSPRARYVRPAAGPAPPGPPPRPGPPSSTRCAPPRRAARARSGPARRVLRGCRHRRLPDPGAAALTGGRRRGHRRRARGQRRLPRHRLGSRPAPVRAVDPARQRAPAAPQLAHFRARRCRRSGSACLSARAPAA